MIIKALCVIGIKSNDGHSPLWPGCTYDVDEKLAKRFVENGSAVEVSNPGSVRVAEGPLTTNPGKNPPEDENGQEESNNGDLESMSFSELKAIAKGLGVEIGKIRSKEGMINAILVARMEMEENFPTIEAQEVVDE